MEENRSSRGRGRPLTRLRCSLRAQMGMIMLLCYLIPVLLLVMSLLPIPILSLIGVYLRKRIVKPLSLLSKQAGESRMENWA